MHLAAEIQRQILPKGAPVVAGFELIGWNRPARQVGGDYYDLLPLQDGRVGLALGDVSGKGMPAALMVSTLHSALRLLLDRSGLGPAFLERLNSHIFESSAPQQVHHPAAGRARPGDRRPPLPERRSQPRPSAPPERRDRGAGLGRPPDRHSPRQPLPPEVGRPGPRRPRLHLQRRHHRVASTRRRGVRHRAPPRPPPAENRDRSLQEVVDAIAARDRRLRGRPAAAGRSDGGAAAPAVEGRSLPRPDNT